MKKIYGILISILIILILVGLGIFIWAQKSKANLAKRKQNLIELPQGSKYQKLTSDQEKTLFKNIAAKYPNVKTPTKDNSAGFPIIQEITVIQDNQPIPSGQEPGPGDANADPTDPQNPPPNPEEPEIRWPTISYSAIVSEPEDIPAAQLQLERIKTLVEKYYPVIVKLYGEPNDVANRHLWFVLDESAQFYGYLPQYDAVGLYDTDVMEVVPGLIAAFHGNYFSKVPESWEYGLIYNTTYLAVQQFPEDNSLGFAFFSIFIKLAQGNYEKLNIKNYPIWGASISYENDILSMFSRTFTVAAAFNKPYLYDNKFYIKLNQKLYAIPLDSDDWTGGSSDWWENLFTVKDADGLIFKQVFSIFPNIDGDDPNAWYEKQHVLHQTEMDWFKVAAMQAFGQVFVGVTIDSWVDEQPTIYVFSSGATANGTKFYPKNNNSIKIRVENDQNSTVGQKTLNTNAGGKIAISNLQDIGITTDGRYTIKIEGEDSQGHLAYFSAGTPFKLYGAVSNFGQGKITAFDQNNQQLEEVAITNGAFSFSKDINGLLKLKLSDYNGNVVLEKPLAKSDNRYFVDLTSPTTSYPSNTRGTSGGKCQNLDTTSWKTYQPNADGWLIKYPADWGVSTKEVSSTEIAPQWQFGFGPENQPIVWVGYGVTDASVLESNLTNATPGFEIISKTPVTIDNTQATKYLLQGQADYQTNVFAIPFFNLGYLLMGPAIESTSRFDNCEPEIFQQMIQTFKTAIKKENEMPSM